MALSIKSDEADRLARELAAETGESLTKAVVVAASRVELGIVLEARLGPAGADAISRFLPDAEIGIVAVDPDAADRADCRCCAPATTSPPPTST